MHCASDQLTKREAFDQMRNVWSNARAFGGMRSAACFVNWSDAQRICPNFYGKNYSSV